MSQAELERAVTEILVDEETGRITVEKVPSTPDDPARGVVEGVRQLCRKAQVALADVDNLLHGTTVATNIALTHSGAEVGMLTTEGFRDIIHIARHRRPLVFSPEGARNRSRGPGRETSSLDLMGVGMP